MTAAEILTAAAARLRAKATPLLEANAGDDWRGDWSRWFTLHGADLPLLREDEEWIALMRPELAEPIAVWLAHIGETWAFQSPVSRDQALAVARIILGGDR